MRDNLILRAAAFSREAHKGQYRKYTKEPYENHPARVAGTIAIHPGTTEVMVAAAYLHDTIEDTPVTYDELLKVFGGRVADMVQELTNPSKGLDLPRADRKRMDRDHLRDVSEEAKLIKLADRLDNLRDLWSAPKDFRDLYVDESRALMIALDGTSTELDFQLQGVLSMLKNL